jgi:hypothetical protein
MIDLKNNKKNNNHTISAATILTLAIIMMTASTIAAPVAATTATTMPQPLTVATNNQSVNVVISWEPTEIEPGQDTQFTLDFQDPSSGESISHVNYNLEITDQSGGAVQSMTDLHTHSGSDEQTVMFDTEGSFNVVVTIIGTGINPPFDTTQSGTAQTVIPVGVQLASATTTGNNTAITGGGGNATGSACAPTQTGGGAGGQNATTATATNATTAGGGTNATTTAGGAGGNQTAASPVQLIEQACIAAQNNDTQGVLMNLNLALNALGGGGNMTTTADGGEVEDEDGEGGEEEGEDGEGGAAG